MSSQSEDPRWLMRWITLITFLVMILASLIAEIILAYQTTSPLSLALSGSLLLTIRPIIRYLFPDRDR